MLKKLKGFTILQLLLSVALLAIIMAIVYVAINPGKHFIDTRNEQRANDLKSLRNGLQQYTVNNGGLTFPDIDESLRVIGTANSGCLTSCKIVAVEGDPVSARTFNTATSADFNTGSYNNTTYNTAATILELNAAGKTSGSGSYTSKIFDATSTSLWQSLDWEPKDRYSFALPDNKQSVDTGAAGIINMVGNQLLLHLDEAGAAIADSSGSNNNATAVNTSLVSGQFSGARRFTGSNSYLQILNSATLNPTNEISIEAWVKWNINPATGAQWAQIINKNVDDQYQIQHNSNNSAFEFALRTNTNRRYVLSTTVPQQGVWYHIVGTYNGASLRIYVNGTYENAVSLSGTILSSTTPVRIGSRTSNDRFFNGDIDEVAIYNRALSATEISSRYFAGKSKLLMQVRACEDSNCSDASFIGPDRTSATFFDAKDLSRLDFGSELIGRYFQYQLRLETGNSGFTPRVNNISINSTTLDVSYTDSVDECIDFTNMVNDTEMVRVPFDPQTGSNEKTNYAVRKVNGVTQLYACTSENEKLIMNSFR